MPKFRVESSVKCRTSSDSATSGSRGGSDRRRPFGTSGTGRSFGGSVPALRPDFDFSKISFTTSRSEGAAARERSWLEHLGQPVDLGRRPLLGDRDEQAVVHPLVVAPE